MKIEEIYTRITPLNRDVTVRVMTPDGYEEETGRRYPVLYINDGQDMFRDEETFWRGQRACGLSSITGITERLCPM